jgi:ABC-type amino acid transport substrate-binding protein
LDKTVDAFAALNAGQIQGIMLDTPIVLGAVNEKQVKDAEVVGPFKTGVVYGAVVNRGSKNLDASNQVIKQMKEDGTRDRLFKQYFAKQAAVPPEIPF